MKNIFGLLTAALALFATACQRDDARLPEAGKNGKKIELKGGLASRAPGDVGYPLHLYALPESATAWNNIFFSETDAYYNLSDNSIASNRFWPSNGDKLRFVGVMNAGDNGTAGSTVSTVNMVDGYINVKAGEGYGYDIMLSNNLTAGKGDTDNEMVFRHVMTQLIIKLNLSPDITTDNHVTGTIAAGKANGTYSALAADDQVMAAGGTGDYNLPYDVTIQNQTPGQGTTVENVYHLVADGSLVSEMVNVKVNDVEVDNVTFMQGGSPASIELKPGISYTLTLNVGSRGIEGASLELLDWQEEQLDPGQVVTLDKKFIVLWDAAGADVTSIELEGPDGAVFTADVEKDPATPGKGYVETSSEVTMTINKVYGYRNGVRVEMTSPKESDNDKALWKFTPATQTDLGVLELQRVLVETLDQLVAIDHNGAAAGIYKHHYQVADIDMSSMNMWWPIGVDSEFFGSYVGGGFKLKNFTNNAGYGRDGLFGVNNTGLISDVHISSGYFVGAEYGGAICGANWENGVIRNCVNEASIVADGNIVGGIAGENKGKVINCTNRGAVAGNGKTHIGGVIGLVRGGGKVENCVNYGDITNAYQFGGITGTLSTGTITDSKNYGKITTQYRGGGIAGYADAGTISNSSNHGEVSGTWYMGGIIGENFNVNISKCKNSGKISGSQSVGGIVGKHETGSVADCENRAGITGTGSQVGGILGSSTKAIVTNCVNYEIISGPTFVGGIIGHQEQGDLSGSQNKSESVSGKSNIGGVVGKNNGGAVYECTNSARISGEMYLGGISGDYYGGTPGTRYMQKCINTGVVESTLDNPRWEQVYATIGGISGATSGPIINCENKADVIANGSTVGGIVGHSNGYIKDCVNHGNVEGCSVVGGLVGQQADGISFDAFVSGSKNYGKVTGKGVPLPGVDEDDQELENVGGLVGWFANGRVENCENHADVKGYDRVGGAVGYVSKFTASMTSVSNFGDVKGHSELGGLVGQVSDVRFNEEITIRKGFNSGNVTAYGENNESVGGICGYMMFTTVDDCHNTGDVSGMHQIGGIAGMSLTGPDNNDASSKILNSSNAGRITAAGNTKYAGISRAAGIIGYNMGLVQNCVNKATGRVTGEGYVGGIAGQSQGREEMCHNEADISATGSYTGGIVGNQAPTYGYDLDTFVNDLGVFKCANTGDVKGRDYTGGIAGRASASLYSNVNTANVTGTSYVGGIVGTHNDEDVNVLPDNSVIACYNTGAVTASGTYVGGIAGEVFNASVNNTYESNYTIQACYNTGAVSGSSAGILVGQLRDRWGKTKGISITNNFWGPSTGQTDVVGTDDLFLAVVMSDNNEFSAGDWPADDATTNWGVGDDAAGGLFWKPFGAPGSTSYPVLAWE